MAAGAARARSAAIDEARERVRVRFNLPRDHKLGVGVDRLDYTKGIIERFNAVARLLELRAASGSAASRSSRSPRRRAATIANYQDYAERVHKRVADEINARIRERRAPADHPARRAPRARRRVRVLRGADVCFVSSLHDGMNLVAKEFVAARDDERGVLILSQFAGASRELPEALIVNPYDADQCAAALHVALTMPAEEQRDRMRLMRNIIREFNVYRWAGRMLLDAAAMRQRKRFGEQRRGGDALSRDDADYELTPPRVRARFVRAAAAAARASDCALFLDIDGTLASSRRRPTPCASTRSSPRALAAPRARARRRARARHRPRDHDVDRSFPDLQAADGRPARLRAARRARDDPPACAAPADLGAAAQAAASGSPSATAAAARGQGRVARAALPRRAAARGARAPDAAPVAARGRSGTSCSRARCCSRCDPDGRDKGTAIDDFMAEAPFAGRCPCSSATISPTSTASPPSSALGGWTVKVGPGRTDARFRLPTSRPCDGWLTAPIAADAAGLRRRHGRFVRPQARLIANAKPRPRADRQRAHRRAGRCRRHRSSGAAFPRFDGDPVFCACSTPRRPRDARGMWSIEWSIASTLRKRTPTTPRCW